LIEFVTYLLLFCKEFGFTAGMLKGALAIGRGEK